MPGFQSLAQRALAQPPRRYADGGLVDDFTAQMQQQRAVRRQAGLAEAEQAAAWSESEAQRAMQQLPDEPQAFADGGPVGFGSRGVAQLKAMIPQVQAMGYQQAAPAPAPAVQALAAPPRSPAGLRAVIPQVESMGYKQASAPAPQYFAEGGVVRGPGTGTSDSIEDEVPPESFIMPADSTQAVGMDAMQQLGAMPQEKVPVRLSDGETKIPPDQVMAFGAAVLQAMKDLTHTPVNGQDGGQTDAELAEPAGFADGGLVDPARRPNSFGDAAAAAADPSVTQVRTSAADTFGRAAPAPAPAPSGLPSAAARMASTGDPTNPYAANNASVLSNFANQQGSRGVLEMGRAPAPAPLTARNSFGDAAAATVDPNTTQVAYTPGAAPSPLVARAPAAPAVGQPAGFAASARMASPAPAPAAPMGWADRQAQRNADVSAASITNRPEWSRATAAQRLGQMPNAPAGLARRAYADGGVAERRSYADGNLVRPEDDRAVFGFFPQLRDNQNTTHATGNKLAQGVQATPTGFQPAAPAAEPPLPPAPARMNNLSDPRSTEFAAASPAPLSAGPLGRAASMSPPVPEPAAQALAGGITRDGSSYSGPAGIRGDVTINGGAPRNGGAISGQNMAAADSLAGRASQESAARVLGAMPAGFQGAAVQPPTVLHSGNDWQSRNDLRNAQVSATSIMNNGGTWDKHKGESAESLTYRALLGNDMAARGAVPRLAGEAMQQNAESSRAAQANAGAMDRSLVAERAGNTQAGIQAQGLTLKAVIDARKSGQPPAGYRWAANGTSLEAVPGGPAADGKPLTEDQAKSAGYALRMDNALKLMGEIGKQNPGATRPGVVAGVTNMLPEGAANMLRPEARQRVESAQLDALDAALTLNTGAAYTREQLQGMSRSYFAQPGDDDKTVADKQTRLNSLIQTARLRAGDKGAAMADTAQTKVAQGAGQPAARGAVPDDVGALLKKYGG